MEGDTWQKWVRNVRHHPISLSITQIFYWEWRFNVIDLWGSIGSHNMMPLECASPYIQKRYICNTPDTILAWMAISITSSTTSSSVMTQWSLQICLNLSCNSLSCVNNRAKAPSSLAQSSCWPLPLRIPNPQKPKAGISHGPSLSFECRYFISGIWGKSTSLLLNGAKLPLKGFKIVA